MASGSSATSSIPHPLPGLEMQGPKMINTVLNALASTSFTQIANMIPGKLSLSPTPTLEAPVVRDVPEITMIPAVRPMPVITLIMANRSDDISVTESSSPCHRAIFYTHFSSFLTSFPLHFSGLFHSILQISIPHQHTRSLSFLLPFLKTCKRTARR